MLKCQAKPVCRGRASQRNMDVPRGEPVEQDGLERREITSADFFLRPRGVNGRQGFECANTKDLSHPRRIVQDTLHEATNPVRIMNSIMFLVAPIS